MGTFAADLEPRVYTFWRSRPISVHQWFWSKFAIGFAAVVLTVGVPGLAATAVLSRFDDQLRLAEAPLYILFYWFCMYAAAVLATCVVRHILYAAMLAIGLLVLMFWLPFLPRVLSLYAEHPTTTAQAAVCLTAACVCVLLAWQSAARNLAWRTS